MIFEIGCIVSGLLTGGSLTAWLNHVDSKVWAEAVMKQKDIINRIKAIIQEDRENFLKVDAHGMTRDELAAFQKEAKESGGTAGAWPDDPCEAVKAILADWHIMRGKMIDAEAKAAAAEWRSSQYGSLQAVNTEFNDIVAGVRDRLATSPDSPFGVYTGRFPSFAKLALFLVDQALRAQAPPETLAKFNQEIAETVKAISGDAERQRS